MAKNREYQDLRQVVFVLSLLLEKVDPSMIRQGKL